MVSCTFSAQAIGFTVWPTALDFMYLTFHEEGAPPLYTFGGGVLDKVPDFFDGHRLGLRLLQLGSPLMTLGGGLLCRRGHLRSLIGTLPTVP